MNAVAVNLKWKRLAPGKYAAATPCEHLVIAERRFRDWILYFQGGYMLACKSWPTVAKAKESAPTFLDLLRRGWEQRQADEAAKAKAETDQRIASVLAACRLRDSKAAPPAGVPWYQWAERRVGCTAADVHKANEGPTLADVLEDWYSDNYADHSADDIRRKFCEWYFETVP